MTTTLQPANGHSRLAPSSSGRWVPCTASVPLIEWARELGIIPKDDRSDFADEGTLAHDLAANVLAANVLAGRNKIIDSNVVEMVVNVREYINFCRSKKDADDRMNGVEKKVPLFYLPSQNGTVDFFILGKRKLTIVDLKYGAGVGVYAERNPQLGSYAESIVVEIENLLGNPLPDDFPVELYIFQPRDRNDSEPVRPWLLTRGELREFTRPIEASARLLLSKIDTLQKPTNAEEFEHYSFEGTGLKLVPGPHCSKHFCPLRGVCKAYATDGFEVISGGESVDVVLAKPAPTMLAPTAMTRAQRLRVIGLADKLVEWLKAVEAQEMAELMGGAEPIDYKIVEGKSNRAWVDEVAVTAALAAKLPLDQVAPRSVISPAQAEKLIGKKSDFWVAFSKEHVAKPPGKPTMVPISDERPALEFKKDQGFEDLDVI